MNCKCGPEMKEATHKVTTEKGKLKWVDPAPKGDIKVQLWECDHCGRVRYKVHSGNKCIKVFN